MVNLNIQETYEYLKEKLPDLEIKQNENMAKHTTFKVGGNADIWIKVKKLDELIYVLKYSKENRIPITVIGNGSNLLVKDKGIRGITIKLENYATQK